MERNVKRLTLRRRRKRERGKKKPKTHASILLNVQKLQVFPLRSKTRWGMSAFTSLIQKVLRVLATTIREEEEIKGIQIGKEEVKLSSFTDEMIL